MLFPGMEVRDRFTFRVTRNEDLEVEEDDAENLLTALEKELTRRRFGPPVRLEVEDEVDGHVLDMLIREPRRAPAGRLPPPKPLDLRGLNLIADLERSDLKYDAFRLLTHPDLAPAETSNANDILPVVRERDVLLQHPYHSFDVGAGVHRAGRPRPAGPRDQADPLPDQRRLHRRRPHRRREAGKQVLAVVEIKARFDEQNNISWARSRARRRARGLRDRRPQDALQALARRPVEPDGLVRYCHVGTGNYNPKTARLYEDFGLLTSDPQVGEDLTRLFNQLSGIAPRSKFKRLLVAPRSIRSGLVERIEAEIEHAEAAEDWSSSRSTRSSTRRSSTPSTVPPRPACTSTSGSGASARCAPGWRACPRTSPCTSSAGSSSTRGCSSARAASPRSTSAAPT